MADNGFKIGFVGAGKMAHALVGAILRGRLARPQDIICSDPLSERLGTLQEQLGVLVTQDNQEVFRSSDVVVLAFKPQNFPQAIEGVESVIRPEQIIISIMAGVRIARIQRYLPARIVRVMPNTPCLVGEMAAGFAVADNVTETDLDRVRAILQPAGIALQVPEQQIDAVTGLSGSGPAFVAYLVESFITAGINEGLEEETARQLALKTFAGTARLLSEWNLSPRELIEMVSSPGGTTIAGREILESSNVKDSIINTIKRAAQRSRELGQDDK